MLYVGATLMIGASIYGFVDYKKTSHQKEFTTMYEEDQKVTPVLVTADKEEPAINKELAVSDKKAVVKKQVTKKEEFDTMDPIKPINDDEMVTTKETKEIGTASVDVKAPAENNLVKKLKKKKRLNTKIFSRAPLREEIDIVEAPKEEVKKTENKEQ